jgi:hypothetical protein
MPLHRIQLLLLLLLLLRTPPGHQTVPACKHNKLEMQLSPIHTQLLLLLLHTPPGHQTVPACWCGT